MLEAVRRTPIIAGAYTSGEGICPMLAAHRGGGRTSASSFARTWDRFAFRGARVTRPRPATARELMILSSHLEASLAAEDSPEADLAAAIVSHQGLVARRAENRESAPRPRQGWSWMRAVRSYDEYERLLGRLEHERTALEQRGAREPIVRAERQRELV